MHMNRFDELDDPDPRRKYRKQSQCMYRLMSQFAPGQRFFPLLQVPTFRETVQTKYQDILDPTNDVMKHASKYYKRKFRILARRCLHEMASFEYHNTTPVYTRNLSLSYYAYICNP